MRPLASVVGVARVVFHGPRSVANASLLPKRMRKVILDRSKEHWGEAPVPG